MALRRADVIRGKRRGAEDSFITIYKARSFAKKDSERQPSATVSVFANFLKRSVFLNFFEKRIDKNG